MALMTRVFLPHATFLIAACLASAGLGSAQDNEAKKHPKIELPDINGMQVDKKEMVRLFHEVEHALGSIDLELADAGAGRIPVPEGKDSGIERLLRSQAEKSDQAVSGIDKILELAAKLGGSSGGT
jgi:hypothetical protein